MWPSSRQYPTGTPPTEESGPLAENAPLTFLAIRIAAAMSLLAADLTVCSENATPILALKQMYQETGVPSQIRIKISNSGILSIDDFANLGESSAELLVGIASILGVEPLGKGRQQQ